jgi:hypothetical protein
MSDLLIQAMTAKQNGDNNLAKQLLSQAIVQNPRNEAAWMLMAEVVDDVKLRRNCLERVLALNPDNTAASMALTRLNTSPLAPIVRGERNKPVEAQKIEKTPPFTPPFTWDSQPEQYLALGDHTFPELTGEETNPLSEPPPTFDWASESEEPDKTIDKIFEAVSKPELASEPPPAKEANWLDALRPEEEIVESPTPEKKADEKKEEDPWLQELVGAETEASVEPQALTPDDFSVSAEPELGLQAFASTDISPTTSSETGSSLWDNPTVKSDRLVILSSRSLIYASPAESDIPHIMGLFNEGKMVRDLLGDNAHIIKLEEIDRVTTDPKTASFNIDYKPNGKSLTHQITFSSPEVRDEVLTALKFRLGAGFKQTSHSTSMEDKILSPILIIILVAILVWILIGGVPLLSNLPGLDTGQPQAVLASIQQVISQIGILRIILLAVVIAAACVVWMVRNLKKPSSEIILHR